MQVKQYGGRGGRTAVINLMSLTGYGSQGGRPPLAIDCPLPRSSSLFSLKCTRGYLGYDGPDR